MSNSACWTSVAVAADASCGLISLLRRSSITPVLKPASSSPTSGRFLPKTSLLSAFCSVCNNELEPVGYDTEVV